MVLRFLLCLLFTSSLFATSKVYMGEKKFDLFYGVSSPLSSESSSHSKLVFDEDEKRKYFLDHFISDDMIQFQRFFFEDLNNSLQCSYSNLASEFDYFSYAHRLISLSYLFEALESYKLVSKKLGGKQTCSVNWSKIIKSCNPKTVDMKVFLENLKGYVAYMPRILLSSDFSTKKFRKKWNKSFQTGSFIHLLQYRLQESKDKKIAKVCEEEKSLFIEICSENDSLVGMSRIRETYSLIGRSNLLNIYDDKRIASGCLKSFKKTFADKEKRYKSLELIFPYFFESLSKVSRYAQGRIFPLGALREFREKGVDTVFLKAPKKKKKKIVKKEEKKKQHVVKVLKAKALKKIIKNEKKPVKKKVVRKKTQKSYFYRAGLDFKTKKLKRFSLNMEEFSYDFLFTLRLKKALDKNLKPYLSRKALLEMKNTDKLGEKEGAMPLILIKYMIETAKHQELFTLINVIGDKFYVFNDIDKKIKSRVAYIELKNDFSTAYKWQITLLK